MELSGRITQSEKRGLFGGPPGRSGATDLTDDELLLLDSVADKDCIFPSEDYPDHMNTGYWPSLSDAEVVTAVDSFRSRKLIKPRMVPREIAPGPDGADAFRDYWRFTSAGLAVWEAERRPLWDLYIEVDSASSVESDGSVEGYEVPGLAPPVESITSNNRELIEQYIHAKIELGMQPQLQTERRFEKARKIWLGFGRKILKDGYSVYLESRADEGENKLYCRWPPGHIRWARYHEVSGWWTDIKELAYLRRKMGLDPWPD